MKNKYIKIGLLTLVVTVSSQVSAQVKVGDNPQNVNSDAVLEIESTNKGMILPRIALEATTSANPMSAHVAGMTVYNTATAGTGATAVTPGYYYNDGTKWVRIATGNEAKTEPWYIQETTTEAISNTDNIYQMGSVAIGTDKAYEDVALEVNGSIRVGDEHVGSVGPFSASFGSQNEASNYYSFSIGSDNISSGYYSFTSGIGNIAEGYRSFAQGGYNKAMGSSAIIFGNTNESYNSNFSLALGIENKINGDAIALGYQNELNSDYGFAVGRTNKIYNDAHYAAAFGKSNEINGEYALAVGSENRADGTYSISIGNSNIIDSTYGLGIGNSNNVNGEFAAAIGSSNNVVSNYGIAIGSNLTPSSNYELNFGKFNAITTGNTTAWNENDALIQIANGSDESTRNNALTVLKSGNVAIGVNGAGVDAKPTERLDIGSGNVRVRDINSVAGAATDKIVVADADGVLKTVEANTFGATGPWRVQDTGAEADDNQQDIYQEGKVAVGFTDADGISDKQLEVKGDVKAIADNAGTYSILETNNTDFGVPFNIMLSADNPDVLAATAYGAVSTSLNTSTLNASGANGHASIGVDNGVGGISPRAEMRTGKADNTVTNAVIVGSNGETEVDDKIYLRSEDTTAGTATRLLVDKADGVTFKHGTIGSPSGNYTFPQNNGKAGQVLVTDGAAPTLMTGAQLSWADVSDLVDINEPWRVQGTTNEATANTENIFQLGSVAIGANTIPSITTGSGTVNPMLHVAGDVSTTGKFYTTSSVYADYVFEKYFDGTSEINDEYEFKSLDYIKAFIEENKHLPGVTKIEDLLKGENGYMFDMTELSIQQLEKIEELFLHVIEQNQQINELKNQVEDNNKRLEILENLLLENNSR